MALLFFGSVLYGAVASTSSRPLAVARASDTGTGDMVVGAEEKSIRFNLHYQFQLHGIPPGAKRVDAWVPEPQRDVVQGVRRTRTVAPVPALETADPVHGNRYLYFEVQEGSVPVPRWEIAWEVTRREVVAGSIERTNGPTIARYLEPNRLVPVDDRMRALAAEAALSDGTKNAGARRLYDYVLQRMTYSKHGDGWGRGDARWACDSRYGNCTDYHSLFIAVSRASQIPARFEMGFSLLSTGTHGRVDGYHCWASYHDAKTGWHPVDISEADKHPHLADYFFGRLHARRVHFTTGRDLVLVPPQEGPPLNFFIYPYVEVDGQVHEGCETVLRFDALEVLNAVSTSGGSSRSVARRAGP